MTVIDVSSIDVSIASLQRMAARVHDVAQLLDAGHRELVLPWPAGWSAAAAGDRTGAACALARVGEQWVGYLTGLSTALSRAADGLTGAGGGYAVADERAGAGWSA